MQIMRHIFLLVADVKDSEKILASAAAAETQPKPWEWPRPPNPFGNSPPPNESPSLLPHSSAAAAASPMPASMTRAQPKQAQLTGSHTCEAAPGGRAAQDERAAQKGQQSFWGLPPWGQHGREKSSPGGSVQHSSRAQGPKDGSKAGAGQGGARWSLPKLSNPFEGWGRSVSPAGA